MRIRVPVAASAALLATLPFACRSAEGPGEGAGAVDRTLHSLGLRRVDLVAIAETVAHDVARALPDGPEGAILLRREHTSSLPQGAWSALESALTAELRAACEARGLALTIEPPAAHVLALDVRDAGPVGDRDLAVRYRFTRDAEGAEVLAASTERLPADLP